MKNCTGIARWEWGADAIFELPCPLCGHMVEFFQDELKRTCGHCRARVSNPQVKGCRQNCTAMHPGERNLCSKFQRHKARFYGHY